MIPNELVYKLNLPKLNEVLLPEVREKIYKMEMKEVWASFDADKVLKPEWCFWNGITWTHVALFCKPYGMAGGIHIDNDSPEMTTVWGINWVHGGDSVMEYWQLEDVEDTTKTTAISSLSLNYGLGRAHSYKQINSPFKRYQMEPGAYLVNAHIPHRATGYDERIVISVRSLENYNLTWTEVVDKFKDFIC